MVAAALFLPACRHETSRHNEVRGCTADAECRGERICDGGRCMEPGAAARAGQAEGPAPSDGAWRRGGPAGDRPAAALGPASAPKVQWERDLGSVIFARPTLLRDAKGDEIAYVGTHAGRFVGVVVDGPDAGAIRLDLTVGGMIWSTAAADSQGRLYVGADNDTLYAIDPREGAILWERRLGDCRPARAPGPEGARCDVDGGPTVGPDGDLYVGANGVYRVRRDGTVLWHYPNTPRERARHVFSTPLLTESGLVVFGGQDGFVTALSTEGELRWRYKVGADVDGSPAQGVDGTIYVGADDGQLYALRADGTLRWSFSAGKDIRTSVAVAADGTLYVSSLDANLYSLDPTGAARWVLPTGGRIAASPVLDADGIVYVGSQDDRLYAVTPAGRVRWNVEFPTDIDSSVAISSRGVLVVGSDDGRLRALR